MAKSTDDARDALTDAIVELAKEASKTSTASGSVCLSYAAAANQLAEARAWLSHTGQPHGGTTLGQGA